MTSAQMTMVFCAACTALCMAIPRGVAAAEIECPSQILVHETIDLIGGGAWQSFDTSPHETHYFYAVAFSEGPPGDLVYFNPQKIAATRTSKTEIYDFGPHIKGELWISCLYRDTSRAVTKRLDPKPMKCRVNYDPAKALRAVKKVDCD